MGRGDGIDGLAEAFAFFDEVGVGGGPHPAGFEGVLDRAALPALPPCAGGTAVAGQWDLGRG